jgi:hypothetical protein
MFGFPFSGGASKNLPYYITSMFLNLRDGPHPACHNNIPSQMLPHLPYIMVEAQQTRSDQDDNLTIKLF